MKDLIKRGIDFVRNNPTIISSLFLIIVVIVALLANSFLTLIRFQDNLDKTLRTKALLAENILEIGAENYFSNIEDNIPKIQQKFDGIRDGNADISEIALYVSDSENNSYVRVVSTRQENEKDRKDDLIAQNARKFAASVDDAFAYVSNYEGRRFWNVVKALKTADGNVAGILMMSLSLSESDALVGKTIIQSYAISVGAAFVVLLLVFNHIRLFAYEIKARKLEETDKMKDDFISMASHELKSPLTAIAGYAELLSDNISGNNTKETKEDQEKYLSNIGVSVKRLTALVEDLLNVSRIEQNRLPVSMQPINISSLVSEVVDEMKVSADKKGLLITNSIQNISLASADPERVKQIMINLISNAIKYTPKGSIDIKAKEDSDYVYAIVEDTGLGISSENMKQLFSKFYRIKTAQTENISGTGLGLWIAREISRKMGGDLIAESIEGVGSRFILKIKKG